MKLVADANILFSTLLKEGVTKKIWLSHGVSLCAPSFIIVEYLKHKPYLMKKSGLTEQAFDESSEKALQNLRIIAEESLDPYLFVARTLVNDPKDWYYLACALKENAAIWSNDKHFQGQKRVPVKTTAQLLKELFKE